VKSGVQKDAQQLGLSIGSGLGWICARQEWRQVVLGSRFVLRKTSVSKQPVRGITNDAAFGQINSGHGIQRKGQQHRVLQAVALNFQQV